jgi:hypothetical protein
MAYARVTICLLFSNDRRQGLVINANKFRRCTLLRQESPASISQNGRCRWRLPAILRPICQGLLGRAVFTAAEKKRSVRYASNHSLAAFTSSRNPTGAIAMVLVTTPVKASMIPPRLPRRFIATLFITVPKRSGSDSMGIRDRPLLARAKRPFINELENDKERNFSTQLGGWCCRRLPPEIVRRNLE